MDAQKIAKYVAGAREAGDKSWSEDSLRQLAERGIPREVIGHQAWLLEADVRMTWMRWYVDGLFDRLRYVKNSHLKYADLYKEISGQLRMQYDLAPRDEVNQAAAEISEFAWSEVQASRNIERKGISPQMREDLWFSAEPQPRCALCGYQFSDWARNQFLRREGGSFAELDLPMLVDYTRPRGIKHRDLRIEVDHVTPVSAGGSTTLKNLRLTCGWCNSVKSNHRSIYETSAVCKNKISIKGVGIVALPQPLWVLRIVATRGRCEDRNGCPASLDTHELFVATRVEAGALTPASALVFCSEHDPWASKRYVGRSLFSVSF
ncbi:HNH endonuclease [Kocuria sabuli]|uniref:HNH endonuclease n=1 Tax=Kocuria sabuli TaxID=3071448 RepID=UPI0034D3B101